MSIAFREYGALAVWRCPGCNAVIWSSDETELSRDMARTGCGCGHRGPWVSEKAPGDVPGAMPPNPSVAQDDLSRRGVFDHRVQNDLHRLHPFLDELPC